MTRRFELSGHRGARGLWPENTLAGFAGALQIGVDALELDVVLAADGTPVVLHDLQLDPDLVRGPDGAWIRQPGPAVCTLGTGALRRLDVGRARPGSAVAEAHPRQAPVDGQSVPTLAAVFALAAAHALARFEIEIKTDPAQPAISPDPVALTECVMAEAAAAGMAGRVSLRSFDWRGLHHAARHWPAVPLCFLTGAATSQALAAARAAAGGRPAAWAPGFARLTPALVAAAQGSGLAVKPWTVNRPGDIARLIAWGVDGICTDDLDIARQVMADAGLALPAALALAAA